MERPRPLSRTWSRAAFAACAAWLLLYELRVIVAPGFDANKYPSVWRALQRNRAVTDTYEPGSTFKLVTVAGVLSDRLVSPSTRFVLPYEIQVADRRIHDAQNTTTPLPGPLARSEG